MRHAHYMKPNHKSETPQNAIWFDTETKDAGTDPDAMVHRLDFGWAVHRRRNNSGEWSSPGWRRFTGRREFWTWVTSKTRPKVKTYVFCHNTSFDVPVMDAFGELSALGWRLHMACIDAPPTILTWRKGTKTIQLLDTLNIWRMPLAKLGEHIGLPKLPFPGENASTAEWNTYGKRDTEIIMAACIGWWDLLLRRDMGGFASTLAAQAFRTYRHRHLPKGLLIDADEKALKMARDAYVGGRTECRFIGIYREPTYLLDINSMYPAVMRSERYPLALQSRRTFIDSAELSRWCDTGCAVADVTLNTDVPAYPKKHDGKLVFPVGEFRTSLSTPEIQYALERGHIARIHGACRYSSAPIFRSFVDEMYAWRLEFRERGDETSAWMVKILMNSLYGKFGQRGIVYERSHNIRDLRAMAWDDLDAETGIVTRYRQLGGLVQVQSDDSESRESHPAVASHVCAYARCNLFRFESIAGTDRVFYMDTDSLLVDRVGYERLKPHIDESRLGALKLEGQFDEITIHGPKDYVFGDKYRCKGVKASALWSGPCTVHQEKWSSLRGLLRSGRTTDPTTTKVSKTLSRNYTKGIVDESGRVRPLTFKGDTVLMV